MRYDSPFTANLAKAALIEVIFYAWIEITGFYYHSRCYCFWTAGPVVRSRFGRFDHLKSVCVCVCVCTWEWFPYFWISSSLSPVPAQCLSICLWTDTAMLFRSAWNLPAAEEQNQRERERDERQTEWEKANFKVVPQPSSYEIFKLVWLGKVRQGGLVPHLLFFSF